MSNIYEKHIKGKPLKEQADTCAAMFADSFAVLEKVIREFHAKDSKEDIFFNINRHGMLRFGSLLVMLNQLVRDEQITYEEAFHCMIIMPQIMAFPALGHILTAKMVKDTLQIYSGLIADFSRLSIPREERN